MNNIEVQLPGGEEGKIICSKIGSMYNGEFLLEEEYEESGINLNALRSAAALEKAAKTLIRYEESGAICVANEEGIALITDLEEGVYLIHSYEESQSEMIPTLVFVPTWMESEGVMLHNVTVVPKMEKKLQMGDPGAAGFVFLFIFSFFGVILAFLWRKHLRKKKNCDTMQ